MKKIVFSLVVIWFIPLVPELFATPKSDAEFMERLERGSKLDQAEIDYQRDLKLLEKQTEVLGRLKILGAPTTNVSSSSSSKAVQINKQEVTNE